MNYGSRSELVFGRTCPCAQGRNLFLSKVFFLWYWCLPLRVEFLLKTDSGYPRDAEVTLFTLANPEHSLRFNTHWSAPPVSTLARSGGPRQMSQSPVSRNSNIERRMDRPRAVVGVIYLRAIGYRDFSTSQCATRLARERKVCPSRSRMEG